MIDVQCPVCGCHYEEFELAWSICPCCSTQFGISDTRYSYAELRSAWIKKGAPWISASIKKPLGWSPIAQLRSIGYVPTVDELQSIEPLSSKWTVKPVSSVTVTDSVTVTLLGMLVVYSSSPTEQQYLFPVRQTCEAS